MKNTNASEQTNEIDSKLASFDGIEGVAASCLLALAFSFVILREDVTLDTQKWIWLIYAVSVGLTLSFPRPRTIKRLILLCTPSCVVFFLALIFQGGLALVWEAMYVRVLSWPPVPSNDVIRLVNAGFWYLFLFIATVPAVALSVLAKTVASGWLKVILNVNPNKLGRIEKGLNTLVRIGTLLGFGFLISR